MTSLSAHFHIIFVIDKARKPCQPEPSTSQDSKNNEQGSDDAGIQFHSVDCLLCYFHSFIPVYNMPISIEEPRSRNYESAYPVKGMEWRNYIDLETGGKYYTWNPHMKYLDLIFYMFSLFH